MAQDCHGDGANVVEIGDRAAIHRRPRLGAEDQVLRGAGTGAIAEELPDIRRGVRVTRTSRTRDLDRVLDQRRRGGDPPDEVLQRQHFLTRQHGLDLRLGVRRRPGDDPFLFLDGRIVHTQLEHEPVELRLGERIGRFLLDRVLRGEHEERGRELVRLAGDGHRALLHRLQQGGLRLRRRAVDLVRENDVPEDRPLHELEDAPSRRVIFLEQLRAGDVARHEVGRELHARELEVERFGHRLHEQCLGEAGDTDDHHVTAGEDGGDQVFDDLLMPDDLATDLLNERLSRDRELLQQLDIAVVCRSRRGRLGRQTWFRW